MELSPAAAFLLDTLEENGYGAWLVGGCVRDSLRGERPHDFDLATTARPQQVMACFPEFYVIPTGIRHGTVTVAADGGLLEVTTLRAEAGYSDGRRPDGVTFVTDLAADLARRDFTINAMAWNSRDGLVDPFGGQRDLRARLLRCVGSPRERLREDSLRILRCLRFAATLGFAVEEDTKKALFAEAERLKLLAAERVSRELTLLLMGRWAGETLAEYHTILRVVIPEIIPEIDPKLFSSTDLGLEGRLALLLEGGPKAVEQALRRLRLDSVVIRRATELSRLLQRPLPATRREAAEMIFGTPCPAARELCRLWRLRDAVNAVEILGQILDCGCYGVGELAIDGNLLVDMGIQPGRELGGLLRGLTVAVMAGECTNEPRALTQLARRLYREVKM